MEPLKVEVITYAPTAFYHCQHCEVTFAQARGLGDAIRRDQARSALPEDLLAEFQSLSDWTHDMHERYGDRISLRVVDAASLEGFVKSLRHRVRSYPAIVVDGVVRRRGDDWSSIESVIRDRLSVPAEG
ncbi:MAG TPA: hypothetical protein VHJ34_07115 [Actinomycetota bacterium]|nr:hypothetical protein [Actinomycetota bacterium]